MAQLDGQDNDGSALPLHSLAISNAAGLHSMKEFETMLPWEPQRKPRDSNDDMPAMITAAPSPPPTPGHFIASQGDVLLLNTMDQHRSSTQEWIQRATAVGPGMCDNTASENTENPSSQAMAPMSVGTTWGSEGVDGDNAVYAGDGMDDVELSMWHSLAM
jgi:hypothetical protein